MPGLLAGAALCAALLVANTSVPEAGEPALLPANTVLQLEMLDTVSSASSKRGDFFRMRVAQPLRLRERELVAAGTLAVGQVVHAQKAGAGGKGGELILAARYLEMPQGQVRLRSSFGAAGADRFGSSLALSFAVGPLALFVKGKTVSLPAGSALSARVAADTLVFLAPAQGESVSPTPPESQRNMQ